MKEKAVTDSGDEVAREESRDGSKKGNGGREPSRCSRLVCLLWMWRRSRGEGRHSCRRAGQITERPSNQYVTGRKNRTRLRHTSPNFCIPFFCLQRGWRTTTHAATVENRPTGSAAASGLR